MKVFCGRYAAKSITPSDSEFIPWFYFHVFQEDLILIWGRSEYLLFVITGPILFLN